MGDPVTIALGVGGTILSAAGQVQAGWAADANAKAQQQALEYQAKQAEINAGQERASAQRRAMEERRQAGLASSRAKALAAAGGGTLLDPSVVNIMGDLAAEGEYNADVAMYEGEERARDLETGAQLRRYEGYMERAAGRQEKRSGYLSAGATVLKGRSSLMSKYGGGGGTFADGSPKVTQAGGETIYWNSGRYG